MTRACIFYIVGSSGVGKDSIINGVKYKLSKSNHLISAKRFITRPNEDGNEIHIPLSKQDFLFRKEQGLFALTWEAHNYHYAIGIEIDFWIKSGYNIIINGSRANLEIAKLLYPNLISILIDADKSTIYTRLLNRSREPQSQIESRLKRNSQFQDLQYDFIVNNNASIEIAINNLATFINRNINRF